MTEQKITNAYYSTDELSSDTLDRINVNFECIDEDFEPNNPANGIYISEKPTIDGKGIGIKTPFLRSPFGFSINELTTRNGTKIVKSLTLDINPSQKYLSFKGEPLQSYSDVESYSELLNNLSQWVSTYADTLSTKWGFQAYPRNIIRNNINNFTKKEDQLVNINFSKQLFDHLDRFKGLVTCYDLENGRKRKVKLETIQPGDFVRCSLIINSIYLTYDYDHNNWNIGVAFRPTQVEIVHNTMKSEPLPQEDVFKDSRFNDFDLIDKDDAPTQNAPPKKQRTFSK